MTEATLVRIPALAGGRAAVRLVTGDAPHTPVLGFEGSEWATYYGAFATGDAHDLPLTPTAAIALAGGGNTYYQIEVAVAGKVTAEYLFQVPASPEVQDLADLVGATAIDGASLAAERLLPVAVDLADGRLLQTTDGAWGAAALSTATGTTLEGVVVGDGAHLGAVPATTWEPAREAATIEEAAAGTGTTARAWTPARVSDAAAGWWGRTASVVGASLVTAADAAAGRGVLGLGSAATHAAGDFAVAASAKHAWYLDNQTYDAITGTVQRPAGAYVNILLWAIGPGGPGGSGARIAAAGSGRSGGGGGSGGNISWLIVPYSSIGDEIEYYIAGIRRGGAAATAVGNGAIGDYPDGAYIGLPAVGGVQATGGWYGAAGGTAAAPGADPRYSIPTLLAGGEGGAGGLGAAGAPPLYYGQGSGGGGGGGGISAAGAGYPGGDGAPGGAIVAPPLSLWGSRWFAAAGGAPGTANGSIGAPGENVGVLAELEAWLMGRYGAGGGAGGHAGISVPGGAGGRGGHWGGGGGGGGAALGAGPSGAGGDGGAGAVGLLCW